MGKFLNRKGEEAYNSFGSLMIIIEYKRNNDITVYFPEYDWITYHRKYEDFKNKRIQCPFEPRFYNIGYIGEGNYSHKMHSKIYDHWHGMLRRCYSFEYQSKHPTYKDCAICEEWLNFQNFARWYEENYYEVPGEKMCLDKDILIKGNKIYSPETCIFVPHMINSLFTKTDAKRGELPIGVSLKDKKYRASMQKKKHFLNYGTFKTPEEAFYKYKEVKEEYIKEVADEYSGLIPDDLYFALYSYEVDIDD